MKILVAVDGSKPSLKAVQALIERADRIFKSRPEVELITVHRPVPRVAHLPRAQLAKYYADEGEAMLSAARKKLEAAGVRYSARALVGPVAETIVQHAKSQRCDLILIGTRGMGEVAAAVVGSTAMKVLHLSTIPVLLIK